MREDERFEVFEFAQSVDEEVVASSEVVVICETNGERGAGPRQHQYEPGGVGEVLHGDVPLLDLPNLREELIWVCDVVLGDWNSEVTHRLAIGKGDSAKLGKNFDESRKYPIERNWVDRSYTEGLHELPDVAVIRATACSVYCILQFDNEGSSVEKDRLRRKLENILLETDADLSMFSTLD